MGSAAEGARVGDELQSRSSTSWLVRCKQLVCSHERFPTHPPRHSLPAGHKRWVLFPPGTPNSLIKPKGVEREAAAWFTHVWPRTQVGGGLSCFRVSSGHRLARRCTCQASVGYPFLALDCSAPTSQHRPPLLMRRRRPTGCSSTSRLTWSSTRARRELVLLCCAVWHSVVCCAAMFCT